MKYDYMNTHYQVTMWFVSQGFEMNVAYDMAKKGFDSLEAAS